MLQMNAFRFFKRYKKDIIYISIIIVILLLITVDCKGNAGIVSSDTLSKDYSKDVKFWKDKYGEEHAQVEEITLQKDQFEAEVKKLSQVLKVSEKSITKVTKVVTKGQLSGKLTTHTTIPTDTIKKQSGTIKNPLVQSTTFEYEDKPWVSIKGEVGQKDSIHLEINDTLTITNISKKKWFLARRRYFTDVSNKNPHIDIKGVRTLGKEVKEPNFILAPTMTLGYSPISPSPQIVFGVSIIYYPLSIKF